MKYAIDCTGITMKQAKEAENIRHELGLRITIHNTAGGDEGRERLSIKLAEFEWDTEFVLWNGDQLHIELPIVITEIADNLKPYYIKQKSEGEEQ